jgi:predicted DsbA family dithiol-disulfide isomerase
MRVRTRRFRTDSEELPARAYYAAIGTGKEHEFDRALFRMAWIHGQDVNEERVLATPPGRLDLM